jgi:hypothetical protein
MLAPAYCDGRPSQENRQRLAEPWSSPCAHRDGSLMEHEYAFRWSRRLPIRLTNVRRAFAQRNCVICNRPSTNTRWPFLLPRRVTQTARLPSLSFCDSESPSRFGTFSPSSGWVAPRPLSGGASVAVWVRARPGRVETVTATLRQHARSALPATEAPNAQSWRQP